MAPVIIAKDLYKCYAGFSPVLRGVNIEVEAGELVAIMGPSGCGKSTMLHVLGMLHAPDSGTLEILGTNVLEFNREQTAAFRRGNMGFVMQSSNMFDHSTVFENVEFPLIYENVPPRGTLGAGHPGAGAGAAFRTRPLPQQPPFRWRAAACGHCPRHGEQSPHPAGG